MLNCIQSVLESKYTDYDLYVVDNASSDGSAEAIREKYGSQVKVLVNAENLGGSGGFNTGLRKALEKGYEYLYCLDNDVLVDENAMGELVEFLDTHPGQRHGRFARVSHGKSGCYPAVRADCGF